MEFARLQGILTVLHPRYRGNCGATQPLAVDMSSTALSQLSGTRIAVADAPGQRSLSPMLTCGNMSRIASRGRSEHSQGVVRGRREAGGEDATAPVRIGIGRARGVRNRYRTGCLWTFRRIQP